MYAISKLKLIKLLGANCSVSELVSNWWGGGGGGGGGEEGGGGGGGEGGNW